MKYDIVIVGGGPGGYVAAIYAARQKVKVALIEQAELGGTCLNWGCIPTKALLHSASLFQAIKSADKFGIVAEKVAIDWAKMQNHKATVVKNLIGGVTGLLRANGVDVINGRGSLVGNHEIAIADGQRESLLEADNIILATGSQPVHVPIPGSDLAGVVTSKEALSFPTLPKSMAIIGGGVIGIELGFLYNTLGCKVTIVEMLEEILPRQDLEIVKCVRNFLEKQGIAIRTAASARDIEQTAAGLQLTYTMNGETDCITVEKVLMAVGRRPDFSAVGQMPLLMTKTGLVVDDYLRTSIPNIFAIGDVTGKSMLAHVASHQGITAVQNALGLSVKMDYSVIPSCIYTQPEVACVGLTEEEARDRFGDNMRVARFPFAASGKALAMGESEGFVKIVSEGRYNEILGVHIVGPHATELIAECATAIKLECTVDELAQTIHAHPTLSEAVMETAAVLLGHPIHVLA